MTTQIVENLESFSEAELESLEFVPEELENIESELYPNLESISPEEVAKDLEAYFEGDIEQVGLEGIDRSSSSIGTRVKSKNTIAKTHSPRLRKRLGDTSSKRSGSSPRYTDRKEKGIWTGGRPSFLPGTKEKVLLKMDKFPGHPTKYKCQGTSRQCTGLRGGLTADQVTLDHKTSWEKYIRDHAEPNSEGKITLQSAKAAYSDINNLQGMCRICNSSKNNKEKGLFG